MNNFTEEQIKMIKNMGALSYPPEKIASIMGLNEEEIKRAFFDKSTDFYRHYQNGANMSNYLIDLKLMENAHAGDIKAIEKLEERKRKSKVT